MFLHDFFVYQRKTYSLSFFYFIPMHSESGQLSSLSRENVLQKLYFDMQQLA